MTYWFDRNSGLVELRGLKNAKSGEHVNDAVVTAKIVDAAGDVVEGTEVAMPYDPASRGNYFGTIPAMEITEGAAYQAIIEVTSPVEARFVIPLVGATRFA